MSFYNQDIRFVLPPEIEKALAACLAKFLPVLDERNKQRQACDRCMSLGITSSDPQCIHKVHSVFTKCALNVPVIAELMREFYRTIRNMIHLREMYRFWHISTEPIDRAENELCAAESAFTEMLNDTVAALSEIFLSLEAEKRRLVEKGCTREACNVQYMPKTDKDAEIFLAFNGFFKLFALPL